MKLIWKFNLVLIGVFVIGFVAAGYVSKKMLMESAREEVLQHARLMMEAALATRTYTNTQVKPLLIEQLKTEFIKQTVPAYAATEQFNDLHKTYSDYTYKEATLNPSNPRDRASDWEADVVQSFRGTPTTTEIIGERETPTGRALYLARPIQIKSAACLECHSTVDVAPKTMIDVYGPANGFGWQMNEIIGAQIMSVAMNVPIERANRALRTFLISLAVIFIVTIVLLNAMLYTMVIRRVTRLAGIADAVSLGNMEAGEFQSRSKDEIGTLTHALGRMKTSLVQAMRMLDN